jgi:hypothetical protein
MRHSTFAAALAATLLFVPAASQARSACMAAPLATFEGETATLSPDGRMLALESDAALRFLAFPALTPLASYPRPASRNRAGFGFTPDKKRLWIQRQDGNGLGLVFLDLGSGLPPALPPPAFGFTGLPDRAVAGEGSFVLTAERTQKIYPKPGSLAYAQNYIATIFSGRLLRVSDGAVITRFDHMADYGVKSSDTAQRRLIISFEDDPTDVVPIHHVLVDTTTGEQRALPDNSDPSLSPDGSVIVLRNGDDDDARRVIDAATGAALGAVKGTGWPAISADSNTVFFTADGTVPAQVLRRGAWGTPVAVPGLAGVDRPTSMASQGNRVVLLSNKGGVDLLDLTTLQSVWTIAAGVMPDFSYGSVTSSPALDRIGVYSTGKDDSRRFLVADGATGRVMCQGGLPKDSFIQAVTSTYLFTVVYREGKTVRSAVYTIEDEASARAKTERQVAEASARSAKLSPAKRTEAQQIFKQAFELFRASEFDAAARLFENGLAIDPGNAPAQYYLGETYARAGKKDRALAHYELAAGIAPNSKEGALAATRLGE